jgi:hypothetical protein
MQIIWLLFFNVLYTVVEKCRLIINYIFVYLLIPILTDDDDVGSFLKNILKLSPKH